MITKLFFNSFALNYKSLSIFALQKSFFHHHPRRAVLYIPGDDKKKLKKVIGLNVDCVAFDCEDGVAMNRKDAARKTIFNFLQKEDLSSVQNTTDLGVRVNSLSSGLLVEDLRAICSGIKLPQTIFLPKTESNDDFNCFNSTLKMHLKNRNEQINLIFYAETCKTVMNLPDICNYVISLSKKSDSNFRLSGIVFGSDDFCASLGATRSETSLEILYARQRIVLIAKAFNLQAIDMVFIDFKNDEGLRKQSSEGSALGYSGKQVIHPRQIDIVQESFLPSKEKFEWADNLLQAYEKHQKLGKGAFVYKNQMIDTPTMKQAQNIIHLMNATKKQYCK